MRVLVCGGRHFGMTGYHDSDLDKIRAIRQQRLFDDTMTNIVVGNGKITEIIHGGAKGADRLAQLWAWKYQVKTNVFIANWGTQGHAAGPIRNQRMLDIGQPELVIAFPGGRGTADMVRRAKAAGVRVVEVTE